MNPGFYLLCLLTLLTEYKALMDEKYKYVKDLLASEWTPYQFSAPGHEVWNLSDDWFLRAHQDINMWEKKLPGVAIDLGT